MARDNDKQKSELPMFLRIAVSPGHEAYYVAQLAKEGNSKLEFFETWDERSILVRLASAEDFFGSGISSTLVNGESSVDFDGSRSEPFFQIIPNQIDKTSHKIVRFTEELDSTLTTFKKNVTTFSKNFLGVDQRAGLINLAISIDHSFRRNENTTALLDLVPFLRILSELFESEELWKSFLAKSFDNANYAREQISHLRTYLWRAIRNRIESRADSLDPIFPGTLENGCARLAQAYSSACKHASMYLFPNENPESRFAFCVSTGYEGRVECREIFEELRFPIDGNDFKKRLLLVDVSGPILFQPEVAIVHCVHEMAEYSGWRNTDACQTMRHLINTWLLEDVSARITSCVRLANSQCGQIPCGENPLAYSVLLKSGLLAKGLIKFSNVNWDTGKIKSYDQPPHRLIGDLQDVVNWLQDIAMAKSRDKDNIAAKSITRCLVESAEAEDFSSMGLVDNWEENLNEQGSDDLELGVVLKRMVWAFYQPYRDGMDLIEQFSRTQFEVGTFLDELTSDLAMIAYLQSCREVLGESREFLREVLIPYAYASMIDSAIANTIQEFSMDNVGFNPCPPQVQIVLSLARRWGVWDRALSVIVQKSQGQITEHRFTETFRDWSSAFASRVKTSLNHIFSSGWPGRGIDWNSYSKVLYKHLDSEFCANAKDLDIQNTTAFSTRYSNIFGEDTTTAEYSLCLRLYKSLVAIRKTQSSVLISAAGNENVLKKAAIVLRDAATKFKNGEVGAWPNVDKLRLELINLLIATAQRNGIRAFVL